MKMFSLLIIKMKKFVHSGWKEFVFRSEYFGSHPEYGEGDITIKYLFHPKVCVCRWDGIKFSHGHSNRSENNDRFEEWLKSIGEENYIEVSFKLL